jgi:hypothetical protein
MLAEIEAMQNDAKADYATTRLDPDESGDLILVWGERLSSYLSGIEATYGEPTGGTVAEVEAILRRTQYAITDRGSHLKPPGDEREVHARIEAILRCVYPDLRHKPSISKPIKNFVPDTGLPSAQTLIEYKFVETQSDVRRVADEILADTRGYVSKKWNSFIYVIYETRRLKPENEWTALMRESNVSDDTRIVVIAGEQSQAREGRTGVVGVRRTRARPAVS